MSSPSGDEESYQESQIKIRCSGHLINKHASLEEAFSADSNYYIQVMESDESNTRTDGHFLLKLHKQSYNDMFDDTDNFLTPDSSLQTFETLPIAETTDSNAITTTEKFEVSPQQSSEYQYCNASQQVASDNQTMNNHYEDVVPTTVTLTNDSLKSQSQKSSRTVMTTTGKSLTHNQDHDSLMVATCPAADQKPTLTAKMLHSIYHTLHGSGLDSCPFHASIQDCHEDYDQTFAYGFNQYLIGIPNWYDKVHMYLQCIKQHFKCNNCPSDKCSELWNFCINNKLYGILKHSKEGLLIHSKYQSGKIGTICMEYFKYQECIGSGGCGKVYKFSLKSAKDIQLALKEERTRPMIENIKVFEHMIELNSKHVVKMLEYVVGPYDKDGNRLFLFVMPYMNRGGLHVQFKDEKLSCILDYFSQFPQQMNDIFRNYIIICLHLLRGLQYLQKHGIVHRDVKVSNILVQQNCECASPLQCNCGGDGGVQYVLGDLNLMCMEDDQSGKGGEWEKMLQHAPAGTIGKIAPELFFKTNQGERFGSHKSDVYSACVTMMEILASNRLHTSTHEPIAEFFEAISMSYQAPFTKIQDASKILDQTLAKVQKTAKIKQLLCDSQRYIQQMQAFQGSYVSEIYLEKSPLARILANVYGANILHWTCLQQLPNIYHSNLWANMQIVLDVIKDGVKFMPLKRPDATELITRLEVIHPQSKTLFEKSKLRNANDNDDTQTGYIIED